MDDFFKAGFSVYSIYDQVTLDYGYDEVVKPTLNGRINMHSNKAKGYFAIRTAPYYFAIDLRNMRIIAIKTGDFEGRDVQAMIDACNKLPD